jgi:tetratricopeptide (TPR) repeat protein
VVAAVVGLIVASIVAPGSLAGRYLLPFVFFFLVIIPAHELGHALAGRLVGHHITLLRIGVGPLLASFVVAGVSVHIHALPLAGGTRGFPATRRPGVRLREWIFAAGGLAANVALYVILRRVFGPDVGDPQKHPIVSTAVDANWGVLLLNAIPLRTAEGTMTDGYHLLKIPFWSDRQVQALHAAAEGQLVMERLERGDLAGALELAQEHRRRAPHLATTAIALGVVFERRWEIDAARTVWREGLTQTEDPVQLAYLKNNVAFASALLGDARDLPEAGRFSAAALAAIPEIPAFVGTRGSVLVRQGRGPEALPLLQRGLQAATNDRDRAVTRVFLARALALVGRHDEARTCAEEARQLDPTNPLLDWSASDAPLVQGGAPDAAAPGVEEPSTAEREADAAAQRAREVSDERAAAVERWRRDARILAFASVLVFAERLGVPHLWFVVVAIFVSIFPEVTGVLALGLMCTWAFVVQASNQVHFDVEPWIPKPSGAAAVALVAAAAWLWLWRRGLAVPSERTRAPRVLGILTAVVLVPTLFVTVITARGSGGSLETHESLGALAEAGPLLIALAVVWATARRRWLRVASVLPVALVFVGAIGGSDWWLEHHLLADVPAAGGSVAWGPPTPAVVLRTRTWRFRAGEVTVSPGATAFAVALSERSWVQVGDFEDRLVELQALSALFVDDERLLVVRSTSDEAEQTLSEVLPFGSGGLEETWTKRLPPATGRPPRLAIDRDTRTVFVDTSDADGRRVVLRTGLDGETPFTSVPTPKNGPDDDDEGDGLPAGNYYTPAGAGEIRTQTVSYPVVRDGGFAQRWALMAGRPAESRLATPAGFMPLPGQMGRLRCAPAVGTAVLWCMPAGRGMSTVLLRVDADRRTVERSPERMGHGRHLELLDRTHLLISRWDELRIIDLQTWQGQRLKLPETENHDAGYPVRGGLAMLREGRGGGLSTLMVFGATPQCH